jgi:2-keto-4-pentenoate hydratase/2-oxohepta-3-ene-1,7-dioic acid hydratase in catechol pathway
VKLCRLGQPGCERPAVALEGGELIDVSNFGEDFGERFFETDGLARLKGWLTTHAAVCPRVEASVRFGPCITRPCKIVGVGRNYRAHAAEMGGEAPKEPILFMKAPSALSGPNDDVLLPPGSEHLDWEVELAVVIGKAARHVTVAHAQQHIAGYALFNDFSERSYQRERAGQWTKGKSADSFAPLGPFLVTEGVPDGDVELWLSVNGVPRQRARTSAMIFDVPKLVAYVSEFMTLLPGDVIATGTPEGVGSGQNPPAYLRAGDRVDYGATGLGSASQLVAKWERRV